MAICWRSVHFAGKIADRLKSSSRILPICASQGIARGNRRIAKEVKQVSDVFHEPGIGGPAHCHSKGFEIIVEFCSQLLCQLVRGVFCPGEPEIVNPHLLEDIAGLYEAR